LNKIDRSENWKAISQQAELLKEKLYMYMMMKKQKMELQVAECREVTANHQDVQQLKLKRQEEVVCSLNEIQVKEAFSRRTVKN